jgi:hypothetical protein
MLSSRDLAGQKPSASPAPLAWQVQGTQRSQSRLDLQRQAPVSWDKGAGEVKLHVGLGACARPAHAQVQLNP